MKALGSQLLLMFLLFMVPARPTLAQGSVSIVVTDFETGKPVPDAKVVLTQNGTILYTGLTSDNGSITLQVATAEMLDATIAKPGFNKLMICEVQVTRNKNIQIGGTLTKGSQLQYYTHSYLARKGKKSRKTAKRAFAKF